MNGGRFGGVILVGLGLLLLVRAGSLTGRSEVRRPTDYFTFVPPERGATYADPVFGTRVRRVTDATRTPDTAAGRGHVPFVAQEYPSVCPFNADDSRFVLVHCSYFGLYDGEGRFVADLPLSSSSEPRWSRTDPDVLFYVSGNELRRLDATRRTSSLVHAFPEYRSVRGHGESDLSLDGDHLVLAGDARQVFVYDLSSGRKGPVLDTGGREFDSLHITPDNQVTVTWLRSGASRFAGIELFDGEMRFLRQVARAGGHMAITRDTDGEVVLLWANAADPRPICRNGVVKVRLSDSSETCLLSLDWSLAFHVSAPDRGGWAVVSTHAVSDPTPEVGWKAHTNEIFSLSLDGRRVKGLAHHRSRPFGDYWWQPRVSVSHDGSRLLYTSNYGLPSILGLPREYADTYLMLHPS